jgi:hypothetical protein
MRFLWGCVAIMLITSAALATTADAVTYHYDYATQSLIKNYLGSNTQSFALGLPADRYVMSVAVDATGRYAVLCYTSAVSDEASLTVLLRDIEAQTTLWARTETARACSLGMGAFNEGGDLFAMGLVYYYPWEDVPLAAGPYTYSYGIYSTIDGALRNTLDMAYVPLQDTTIPYLMTTLRHEAGNVVFKAVPTVLEGPLPGGDVYAWDEGFSVTPQDNVLGIAGAAAMPTGEVLYPDYEPSLPAAESFVPYQPENNVVRVYDGVETRIIYTTPTGIVSSVEPIGQVGARITVLTNPGEFDGGVYTYAGVDVYRDGTVIGPYTVDQNLPQWVWQRPEAALSGLAAFQTAPGAQFAAQAAPTAGSQFTCPGFLPSRLVPGERGQVTPGLANNLREAPAVTSARLGQIPGQGIFTVIAGPVCDTENRAWWQVNYNGLIGWTIEGQGSEYFTTPLPGS